MVKTIRLTVQTGPHKDKKFCFRGVTRCLIGRAQDCFVQLTGADRDLLISRHHCELAMEPPSIRIQDLGSINGTYVNGQPVKGEKPTGMESAKGAGEARIDRTVHSGDLLTVGGTTFQLDIVECPPQTAADSEHAIWQGGVTALKDCPIDCSGNC